MILLRIVLTDRLFWRKEFASDQHQRHKSLERIMCPLLLAAQLFICSIDHFGFLAQFVGICPIGRPYFIRRIFPAFQVSKGHRCRYFARPKNFGSSASDWDSGCAWVVKLSDWSSSTHSALWLVRSGSGGRSVGVGDVARSQDAHMLIFAYIHTGSRHKCWH